MNGGGSNATNNLPPGPSRLPIIGSIHHLLFKLPHLAFHRLAQEHGPVMLVRLGQIDVVVISSPLAASEIMKSKDLNFCTRPQFYSQKVLTYGCTDVGVAPYGPYWRQVKKICTIELLTMKRVRSFRPHFEEEISKLVTDISTSNQKPVNLSEMLMAMMNTITARCAFGGDSRYQERFISAIKETVKLFSGFNVVDFFPSMKFMDALSGIRTKTNITHLSFDTILESIIQEHRAKGVQDVENFVDVLLRIKDEGESEIPLTIDNVKAVIWDMFSGGTETTSTLVAWAMSELMKNPAIMGKVQAEVRGVLKGKTKIEENDIGELHYLKQVIKETLRLHPPLPLLAPRECMSTCQVAGYTIPVGTKVFVNAWAIGRDPQHWDDAENFKPDRFNGSQVDFKGANFEFVPFGAGRRVCPGITFGSAVVELTLASLIFHFNWELPDQMMPQQLDMTESFGITAERKTDLFLLATQFSSTDV